MKLSACMIAKDEEKNIARCIESYKDVVDEIIVVDTGSKDKTVEIAKALGAQVYHYQWNNHFADAKNYALDRAKGDWIIFLDADEYFVKDTARNIISLIRRVDSRYKAIACKMKNIDYVDGKLLDEITHIRIFRRDENIRYQNSIHECLYYKVRNKTIGAVFVDEKELLIHHEGYSLSNRGEKSKRNLELLLQQLDKASEDPSIYHYISDCYFGMEDWEQSIKYARMFVDSGARLVGYNIKPRQNIIESMLRLKCNVDDILKEIYVGIDEFPRHPAFHFYLANMMYDLKRYGDAYKEYEKTLQLQKDYRDIEINSIVSNLYHIYYYMGIIASFRNDNEDALSRFVESLRWEKLRHPDSLSRLLHIIKDFPDEDIIMLLNSLYNKEDKVDLDFIVTTLTRVALPKVLAYYSALRIKNYGSNDLTVVYMLLANKQYDKTFAVAQKCLIEAPKNKTFEKIALISAFMSGSEEYLNGLEEYFSEPMQRFLKAILNRENLIFSQEYKKDYLDFVLFLMLFGNRELLDRGIQLAHCFGRNSIYIELGNLFFMQERYDEALKLYQRYINLGGLNKEEIVAQIYAEGICWYKLREYEKAVASLIEAYDLGYRHNEIYEFLRWSVDKLLKGSELDSRCRDIISRS